MKNFHVPLPDEAYDRLRSAAECSKGSARVARAREAIDLWLRQQLRKARHDAIAAYAAETAGTSLDLDAGMEAAGIEHLIKTGKAVKRGEVHWADLVPRSSSGQTGRRPVIIMSHDAFNQTPACRSIIVVPISTSASQGRRGPTAVEIPAGAGGLPKTSVVVCHQVTTLDRAKLTKR